MRVIFLASWTKREPTPTGAPPAERRDKLASIVCPRDSRHERSFGGLVSESSASQKIVDALQRRRIVPLVSSATLSEYYAVLLHPDVAARFPDLTLRRVTVALQRLTYIGENYRTVRTKFEFPRDPRDAKFIELAIVGKATHIITLDADILSLPNSRTDAGKRFRQRLPNIAVLRPGELLDSLARPSIVD